MPLPLPRSSHCSEEICQDCVEGDHTSCERECGYLHDDDPYKCACWCLYHRTSQQSLAEILPTATI